MCVSITLHKIKFPCKPLRNTDASSFVHKYVNMNAAKMKLKIRVVKMKNVQKENTAKFNFMASKSNLSNSAKVYLSIVKMPK